MNNQRINRALIVGLGSIGMRYLRLLTEMSNMTITCVSDHVEQTHSTLPANIKLTRMENIRKDDFDFAIVCNNTSLHVKTALQLAECNIPMLIEKPLSHNMEDIQKLDNVAKSKRLPIMMGFQMRHHPLYKELHKALSSGAIGNILHLQGYVGQYLPDWRPDQDYSATSSARRSSGGGVILDLCHEIDIAVSLLGKASSLNCICGHVSDLRIETEDIADITLKHADGTQSNIHLNYLEREYTWTTRITGTKGHAVWDYGRGMLTIHSKDNGALLLQDPPGFARDDLFRAQLNQWLMVLDGKSTPEVDLDMGIEITRICAGAHESAEKGVTIQL